MRDTKVKYADIQIYQGGNVVSETKCNNLEEAEQYLKNIFEEELTFSYRDNGRGIIFCKAWAKHICVALIQAPDMFYKDSGTNCKTVEELIYYFRKETYEYEQRKQLNQVV